MKVCRMYQGLLETLVTTDSLGLVVVYVDHCGESRGKLLSGLVTSQSSPSFLCPAAPLQHRTQPRYSLTQTEQIMASSLLTEKKKRKHNYKTVKDD